MAEEPNQAAETATQDNVASATATETTIATDTDSHPEWQDHHDTSPAIVPDPSNEVDHYSNFSVEEGHATAEAAKAAAEAAGEEVESAAASPTSAPPQQHEQPLQPPSVTDHSAQSQIELICRICHKPSDDSSRRHMVHFLPTTCPPFVNEVTTWEKDIVLHVFCGKTASILPSVNQPDLEILSKAGVKNKHGIGPDINAALARTRFSLSDSKEYFIIKEFEAHLQAIRNVHGPPPVVTEDVYSYEKQIPHKAGSSYRKSRKVVHSQPAPVVHHLEQETWAAGITVPSSHDPVDYSMPYFEEEGKIRCGCGGTHLPPGTPKGAASWRSHVMTKRHQKWMEDNGMLGAV